MMVSAKIVCESADETEKLALRLDRPDDWVMHVEPLQGNVFVDLDARKMPLLARILFDFALGAYTEN